jgi:hypothetical protein
MKTDPKHKRLRFASVTKGIRLRLDQMEAIERLMQLDPELDWSKAVRRGLDLFIVERTGEPQDQRARLLAELRELDARAKQIREELGEK